MQRLIASQHLACPQRPRTIAPKGLDDATSQGLLRGAPSAPSDAHCSAHGSLFRMGFAQYLADVCRSKAVCVTILATSLHTMPFHEDRHTRWLSRAAPCPQLPVCQEIPTPNGHPGGPSPPASRTDLQGLGGNIRTSRMPSERQISMSHGSDDCPLTPGYRGVAPRGKMQDFRATAQVTLLERGEQTVVSPSTRGAVVHSASSAHLSLLSFSPNLREPPNRFTTPNSSQAYSSYAR